MTQSPPERTQQRQPPIDIRRLKESIRLSDVAAEFTDLRRAGRSQIGLCPLHDEKTASFVVSDDIGKFYCHGCQASGDAIDLVQAAMGFDFLDAIKYLVAEIPRVTVARHRECRRKLDAARQALAITYARFQWQEASPVEGTRAERYLRLRGIEGALPDTLRFGRPPLWIDRLGNKGPCREALIVACHDVHGTLTGIQRIFLRPDGRIAELPRPKRSLGKIRGSALRLGGEGPELIVCEGPEDGLTLRDLLPQIPVWVALGAGNMPSLVLPDGVKRVLVAGDNNEAGRKAAQDACERFESQGRRATPIFPAQSFADFNDQLRGIRIHQPREASRG
jgi:DNA primase